MLRTGLLGLRGRNPVAGMVDRGLLDHYLNNSFQRYGEVDARCIPLEVLRDALSLHFDGLVCSELQETRNVHLHPNRPANNLISGLPADSPPISQTPDLWR